MEDQRLRKADIKRIVSDKLKDLSLRQSARVAKRKRKTKAAQGAVEQIPMWSEL